MTRRLPGNVGTVLIVGSDPFIVRQLETVLRASCTALSVTRAASLAEGISRIAADPADVILLDAPLCETDGTEGVTKIARAAPASTIIAVVKQDGRTSVGELLEAGAHGCLVPGCLGSSLVPFLVAWGREQHRVWLTLGEVENSCYQIVQNSADAILAIRQDGTVLMANPVAERLFGKRASELIGESFGFPVVNDTPAQLTIPQTGRQSVIVDMRTTAMRWGGEIVSVASLRDVTEVATALSQRSEMLHGAILAIGRLTEIRDPYTAGHQHRVAGLAAAIAEKMELPQRDVEEIRTAGLLHDIGKMAIPTDILIAPRPLTQTERRLVESHPQVGHDVICEIPFLRSVAELVSQHHERLDGSGYPRHLKEGELLPGAKILAVADVVEAMASHRPYRQALGVDRALQEIRDNAGLLYDRDVVDACNAAFSDGLDIQDLTLEAAVSGE